MLQRVAPLALIVCLVMPLGAQVPAGLKMRVDRSTDAQDPDNVPDLKVVTVGKGFRSTGGPAAVFWYPANTVTGNYTVRATFRLMAPSNHRNFYGLVFGGSALEGAAQAYTYFVVAQTGEFLVKGRSGASTPNIQPATKNAAVKVPDASNQSVNTLEVKVAADTITYSVNGTAVHTTPRSAAKTDGIVGVRINHVLDVQVEAFEVIKG